MSSYADTANQLTVVDNELTVARQALADARRAYLSGIDRELAAGVAAPRRAALERARRTLVPQISEAPRRIVVPDLDVDPLADPEELDQRAGELRAAEDELARQLSGLEAQATALDHLAQLRRQHDRAGDLFNRDDAEPHRNTVRSSDSTGAGENPGGGNHLPNSPPVWNAPSFETAVPIVLADVLDTSTLNTFAAAERSGDPALRAEAARKAHDAVARRLDQVRKKRSEIEARAKRLRTSEGTAPGPSREPRGR